MYKVLVFMSTFNGEKYLHQQINSILNQKKVKVSILIRDDGSTDNTLKILESYKKKNLIEYYSEENIGYKKSFLKLLWLSKLIETDYYAFADQDDIWLENKLIVAIEHIKVYNNIPALYTSALQRVDKNLKFLEKQSFKNLNLSIGGEIARHRLAGCTFLFNKNLYSIIKDSYIYKDLNCSHDELTTIICLACGGKVIFDKNSYILFRRHEKNSSIDGSFLYRKIINELRFFKQSRNEKSYYANNLLKYYNDKMNTNAKIILKDISEYRLNKLKTIKLIFNRKIDSGFKFYNIFLKILILFRYF